MRKIMRHRGPDGDGEFVSDRWPTVGFAHTRLAIFDPERGQQPMRSKDGRYVIIFNGAIYNFLELRRELVSCGHPITSYCDTETLLYAFIEWGEDCLLRLNGMFAFCIWDEETGEGFLARDRIGIKPLYYAADPNGLVFGSEIKSILASGFYEPAADPAAIADYLTFQFALGEQTLFKGVSRLMPGHRAKFWLVDGRVELRTERYWEVPAEPDPTLTEEYCIDRLEELLEDAVSLRLRSDVPVGAHLSGGLDSSTVVCVAKRHLGDIPLQTFTGTFAEGPEFDETAYAKIVAEHSGSQYNETVVSGENFGDTLRKIIYYMDEPTAGPGVIPQFFVSQDAARKVKVALGGQGGDELFLGYARHLIAYLEECLRGAIFETYDSKQHVTSLSSIVGSLPTLKSYTPLLKKFWSDGLFDEPVHRYFKLIDRSGESARFFSPDVRNYSADTKERYCAEFLSSPHESLINKISHFELRTSLPSLLQVEDRTSMAASLESRVPLLDHRIVEFMYQVPPMVKFKDGRPKQLFKDAIRHKIPSAILDRKDKMGFPVPLQHWYREGAADFLRDTLQSDRARARGIYDNDSVEQLISQEGSFSRTVWGLVCLETWYRLFIDGEYKELEGSL